MNTKILEKYARLITDIGLGIGQGDLLHINSPVIASDLARAVAKQAYANGARKVIVNYTDEKLNKIKYQCEAVESLTDIPQYLIDSKVYLVENKSANLNILAEDPDLMSDVDADKIGQVSRANRMLFKPYYDAAMSNQIRWSLAAYPNPNWAKKIFPDKTENEAVKSLWKMIIKAIRLNYNDPVKAWEKHNRDTKRRANFLNKQQFVSFTYKNSLGTDFTVGMPKNYIFAGCAETSADGKRFFPNIPTEEVFSAPHKDTANGTLVASMPLVHLGSIIDGFSITFKDGKVVDYSAKVGYDTLKNIIETDEGSARLGEIALVEHKSGISQLNTLFYNTLFDENASCHFALGRAYASCVKNGEKMTPEQASEAGINSSLEHVDFMIGTKDLSVVATTKDGRQVDIIKDGNFVI